MQRKFYRRVYIWDEHLRNWRISFDGWQWAWNAFECVFGVGWCSLPTPYVFEQWWSFAASTIGTDSGSFTYLGARVNWGANPVINP